MNVYQGMSQHPDVSTSVDEACQSIPDAVDLFIVFSSASYDPDDVLKELQARYPSTPVIGCTTSGEYLQGKHYNESIVITGLETPQVDWEIQLIKGLGEFDSTQATDTVNMLLSAHDLDPDNLPYSELFSLLFVDGVSMQEEHVASLLGDALDGIPLIGGSAGDDLKFTKTSLYHQSGVHSDAAVLVIGRSTHPFKLIKHQHLQPSSHRIAVTRADPENRRVYEIDGYPAVVAYARALGVNPEDLSTDNTFLRPLTIEFNKELYTRSIQAIHDDQSISFYCAIEEGMVLNVSTPTDMVEALEEALSDVDAEFMLGCNCILRSLEAKGKDLHDQLGDVIMSHSKNFIAFDTYGEQHQGLHINQTFVALAFAS